MRKYYLTFYTNDSNRTSIWMRFYSERTIKNEMHDGGFDAYTEISEKAAKFIMGEQVCNENNPIIIIKPY